jgi:phospholipase/carboxylesterase
MWFPLTDTIEYSLDAVKKAADYVQDWIDSVKANHPSVTLLGFSMGMAMATTLLRYRPADYAAVVGLSGFVINADGDPAFRDS